MIDVHAHVLPEIDHGSASVNESLSMLKRLGEAGVVDVFCTSHYYASDEQVERFLASYDEAFRLLERTNDTPVRLHRGAEVTLSRYFHYKRPDPRLCLGGGRRMLVELPFTERLEEWVIECLGTLIDTYGIIPVIAHPERYYYVARHPRVLDRLMGLDVEFQVNSASVSNKACRRAVRYMAKRSLIDYVASDIHYTGTSCTPDVGITILEAKYKGLSAHLKAKAEALLTEN